MTVPEFLTTCSFAATGLMLACLARRIGELKSDLDDAHRKLARVQGAQDNAAAVARKALGQSSRAAEDVAALQGWAAGKFRRVGRAMAAIRDEAQCRGKGGAGDAELTDRDAEFWRRFVHEAISRPN